MSDLPSERPGLRTSEGWITLLVVAGCLGIAALRVWRGQDPGLPELLSAAIAATGYAGSRAVVKAAP